MSGTDVAAIRRSAEKTEQWLRELADELGRPGDLRYAFRVLRAFLHALRDRLTVDAAAHLGAQLPEFLRGVYYEGWRPARAPERYHDLGTFLKRVATDAALSGHTEAASSAEAAACVLRLHVSDGEIRKVAAALPRGVADLLAEEDVWL
jgi:uncharacterized protein (DUF2267 family)